ncbi:MAG: hypothetical protein MZV70_00895 [Desulfobacterales bacterium]|nr:hypothetical protein [Desulfobacterales bacterium]
MGVDDEHLLVILLSLSGFAPKLVDYAEIEIAASNEGLIPMMVMKRSSAF